MPNEFETAPQHGRRRWLQFRLRSVLVLLTLLGCGMAWWTYEVQALRRQRSALAQVTLWQEKLAAQQDHWIDGLQRMKVVAVPWWLTPSGEQRRNQVTELSFDVRSYDDAFEEPSWLDDASLATICELRDLQSLKLPRSKITDAGLASLASLRELKYLDLSGTQVTDAGLKRIGQLPALEVLVLNETQIQGAGLRHLAACRIRELSLRGTPLQADQMHHLQELSGLEKLFVQSPTLHQLDLHDMDRLSELTLVLDAAEVSLVVERLPALQHAVIHCSATGSLRKLSLADLGKLADLQMSVAGSFTPTEGQNPFLLEHLPALRTVTMAALGDYPLRIAPSLAALENLEELWLGDAGSEFEDQAIGRFAEHARLRKVKLGQTGISDRGLAALSTLPNLEELSFSSDRITVGGVAALAALPRLRLLHLGGLQGSDDPGVALAKLPGLEDLSLRDCRAPIITLMQTSPSSSTPFAKLKQLRIEEGKVEEIRIAGLPALHDLSLELPQGRVFEIGPLPQLQRLDVSFAAQQVVEQFRMADLPELTWLSLQCGSTGARLPAETFGQLLSFGKLRGGIVYGLELPDEAKSQLVRFHEATGIKLH